MRTFIIAEAGVNHNGSVDTAKKLIDAAKEAGADAVKFQTFTAEKLVTVSAPQAAYQRKTSRSNSQLAMLRNLQLNDESFIKLFYYTKEKGIVFMSTPFDNDSVDLLESLGMMLFKIPSGEITNKLLIQHIARKKKPIILSTGMSYLDEVEKAIRWIKEVQCNCTISSTAEINHPLILLHCVSDYPADFKDVNLRSIQTMYSSFGLPVGYSDHTLGIEAAIASVALGACVVEKHFTLDREMIGPDHGASIEPHELKRMIQAIRNVENAMGDGVKRPTASEIDTRNVVRRSLVAAKDIESGKILDEDDIVAKRPGTGICPEFLDMVLGKRAAHNIKADSIMTWGDIQDA